jgi:EAL and modified HD-GYP domain-containing signal transduction protein
MDVFIVRKPVMDRFSKVYGYKLVHSVVSAPSREENSEDSALQLIENSVLVFDLQSLASGKKVFFTFTEEALQNGCAELLPKDAAVIDLHPSVPCTEDSIASCLRLKNAGFTIAAPLSESGPRDNPLLGLANIVSADFRQWPTHDALRDQIRAVDREKIVLARSVDTLDEYTLALDLGCTYVQGQFFSKPVIVSGRDVPGFKPNYLKLLQALNQPELDFRAIADIISREVSLTYKLLRLVNSALFGQRVKINAIDRALLVLGERGIRQWASMIAVSELASEAPAELIVTSAIRGRFCQIIGETLGAGDLTQDLFLVGLFSLLDTIASRPLEGVLDELGINSAVKDALTGQDNQLRPIYDLVLAYEGGSWDAVHELAGRVGLDRSELPGLYLPAVEWANSSLTMTD